MSNPLLSVITVNLNNAKGLEQTIQSVINQPYQPLEYLVIDGDSKDESKTLLNKNSGHISYIISEKDNGIYHAMNKGIAKATGDYLLFLNSGDVLCEGNPLQDLITNGNSADIIYGDIQMTEGTHSRHVVFPAHLTFKFFFINSLPHSSTLIKRQLFTDVGFYREDLKVASDWAFFALAVCRHNCSYKHVNVTAANFQLGGISSTHLHIIKKEREQILKEHFPAFTKDYQELFEIEDAWVAARKQLGYRVHHKIRRLFQIGR